MFTSPLVSKFFPLGQVIETVRGAGIYQPALDTAIKRVDDGGWVSLDLVWRVGVGEGSW